MKTKRVLTLDYELDHGHYRLLKPKNQYAACCFIRRNLIATLFRLYQSIPTRRRSASPLKETLRSSESNHN